MLSQQECCWIIADVTILHRVHPLNFQPLQLYGWKPVGNMGGEPIHAHAEYNSRNVLDLCRAEGRDVFKICGMCCLRSYRVNLLRYAREVPLPYSPDRSPLLGGRKNPSIIHKLCQSLNGHFVSHSLVSCNRGAAARIFTTITTIGYNWSVISTYLLSSSLALLLLLQILYYKYLGKGVVSLPLLLLLLLLLRVAGRRLGDHHALSNSEGVRCGDTCKLAGKTVEFIFTLQLIISTATTYSGALIP